MMMRVKLEEASERFSNRGLAAPPRGMIPTCHMDLGDGHELSRQWRTHRVHLGICRL
jgi:hypothetical protein